MMIDIFVLNLNKFDALEALNILPLEIRDYARGLKLERKRIEYIASQWLRYKLFSECLGITPTDLRFSKSKNGRPFLVDSMIDFNISHTRDYAVIAIAKGQRVGIDVQTKKEKIDVLAIAKQYFAQSEYGLIAAKKDESAQKDVFYWLWAYKEASLKLTGEGIANGLNRYIFEVNESGECKKKNAQDNYYFHQQLDSNTLLCLSFERSNSKVRLKFL
ncbi:MULTISPECIES: 4'-phosphopantetheinyl transferase family protein [Cysteiniphilum]|uniref:4'-phosphopantetheinyl transferase family protein n=1 Tax=Cysteiniphilum TaxID=2056696 RepID=UPI00177C0E5C|nr:MULTISPECIES: 4'-phosphopantetheinyl transferase superfamily protein [Cysteiniphilum]